MRNYVTTYDPFFDLFFQDSESNKYNGIMNADLLDKKDHYLMKINMPGVDKEDVKISLQNGYLNVKVDEKYETNSEDGVIFQERGYWRSERSFYVGEDIKLEDISAKLNKGVLELNIKKPSEEEIKKNHYIDIQ